MRINPHLLVKTKIPLQVLERPSFNHKTGELSSEEGQSIIGKLLKINCGK